MRRALYLQGRAGTTVEYDEPALVVTEPDKSRLLFPLVRVSRVVVCGEAEWNMAALFACADAGIAVVFMSASGELRGRWLGSLAEKPRLLQQFTELLRGPDASLHYRDWFAAMRRMAVRSAARRLRFADWQTADADSLHHWLQRELPDDWRLAGDILRGFLLSFVIQYLGDFGLDGGETGIDWAGVRLADDLAALLLWDFYPVLVSRHRSFAKAPDKRHLAALVDRRGRRVEQLLRGLLNRLHRCLSEAP